MIRLTRAKFITRVNCLDAFKSLQLIAISGVFIFSGCQSVNSSIHTKTIVPRLDKTAQVDNEDTLNHMNRHEYHLDNGLQVIIKEDHRAPVVVMQVWYKVGASDEPKDKGGISHLLEHMMFKGTQKVSSNDFERLIAKFGGKNNAFTSYDYTGYYEVFPANRLPLALELEADRMINLNLAMSDFSKERQVVMEERRQRTDDNPIAKAYEEFRLVALPDSPKGESVIGPMQEIKSITLKDLKQWYQTWYAPNNAILVVTGDVNPNIAMQQIKQYFANLKVKPIPPRPSVNQPSHRGYQHLTSKQAVKVPTLFMAFNVPSLQTAKLQTNQGEDAYALSLAQDILDGGLSARFEKALIRKQKILASVSASYSLFERGDGLFFINATPSDGISLKQAENAIIQVIADLSTASIAPFELQRAKTNTLSSLIFAQDSMQAQAQMIGALQAQGLDDRLLQQLPKNLEQVTTQDIKQVATKYLTKDNLTVMYVVPR